MVGIIGQARTAMNRTLLSRLVKLHIITPGGIYQLAKSFVKDGISLMALMRFSASCYPNRCAVVSNGKRLTYKEIYDQAYRLTRVLFTDNGLKAGMCVGLLCKNHIMTTLLLPALSRLGVNVKLMNTGMAQNKLNEFVKKNKIDLLIYDTELKDTLISDNLPCVTSETEDLYQKIREKDRCHDLSIPHIKRGGNISVFTGGSSGKYKEASRRMSTYQFLPPLFALLNDLHIDEYDSVALPLPLYHGFGLATLIVSFLMGKRICLINHFDADEVLKIIAAEKIEVLPVVPAMLVRLWQTEDAPSLMNSVRCIISGGDRLDKKWINFTNKQLGQVLYNLYGTTEAGFFMIASPEDLSRNEEVTIGKPIRGVKCKIKNTDSNGIGSLWVCSSWAMSSMKDKWQNTGDLVYRNSDGCYFYRGRTDNMVVCGGENVYPEEVERIINGHPEVLVSMVFPISDPLFGTVLNANVELIPNSSLPPDEIKSWLSTRLSRAEMPHHISIQPINISETGKMKRNKDIQ